MEKIPKKIHYLWFGGNPLTDTGKKSLETWKTYAPTFQIIRHDESSFDFSSCQFALDAAKAKRWAFAADYARFKILYEQGGVYFDVGTELVKSVDGLFDGPCIAAIEKSTKTIASGLVFATPAKNPIVKEILDAYQALPFYDDIEYLRKNTVNEVVTKVFEKYGFIRENREQEIQDWIVYPSVYFNPKYGLGGYDIKTETYAIHHSSASWEDNKTKLKLRLQKRLVPFIGRRPAEIIGRIYGEIRSDGFKKGITNLARITKDVVRRSKES